MAMPGPVGELPRERSGDAGRQRRQPEPADVGDAAEVAPDEPDDADREQDDRQRGERRDGRPVADARRSAGGRRSSVKNDSGLSASMTGDSVA